MAPFFPYIFSKYSRYLGNFLDQFGAGGRKVLTLSVVLILTFALYIKYRNVQRRVHQNQQVQSGDHQQSREQVCYFKLKRLPTTLYLQFFRNTKRRDI